MTDAETIEAARRLFASDTPGPALWLSIVVLLGAVWFTMLAKC